MKMIPEEFRNCSDESIIGNSDPTTKVKKWESADSNGNKGKEEKKQEEESLVKEEITEDNSIVSAYDGEGGGNKLEKTLKLRKKEEMEKTKAMMGSLIQRVAEVHIKEESSDGGDELTGKFSQLNLKAEDAPSEPNEPKEDDERGDNRSSDSDEEDVKYKQNGSRTVKLDPPVLSNKLLEKTSEEAVTRSPAGIPVHHKRLGQNNHFGQQLPPMPGNFPNYNQQQMCNNAVMGHPDGGHSMAGAGKRCMDFEGYSDASKFVRPQQMPPTMPQNNLDAPGMPLPANDALPLSPTSFRPVSTVCVNQMAGGTVFAAEDQQPMPVMCPLIPPVPQSQTQLQQGWGMEYRHNQHLRQDAFCFSNGGKRDYLEEAVNDEEEGRVDSEEIERLLENALAANLNKSDTVITKDLESLLQSAQATNKRTIMANQPPGEYYQPGTSPPWNYQQEICSPQGQQASYQDLQQGGRPQQNNNNINKSSHSSNTIKNSLHRNSLDDMGYGTDQTLSPESNQFSPCPASPGNGVSPPYRQTWSPPPSNLSELSQDSGVGSPLAEDVKSTYGQSPPLADAVSKGMHIVPPVDYPLTKVDFTEDINYKDPYIDANLLDLNMAIQVADDDIQKTLLKTHARQFLQQKQQQQQQQQQPLQQQWQTPQQQLAKSDAVKSAAAQPTCLPMTALNPSTAAQVVSFQGRNVLPQQMTQAKGNRSSSDNFDPKLSTASVRNMAPIPTTTRILPNTATVVTSSAAPITIAFTATPGTPMVTKNGKVAIPPNNPRQSISGCPMMVPVLVVPQSKPRFQPIAPKDPTKQNGAANVNGGIAANGNCGVAGKDKAASPANGQAMSPANVAVNNNGPGQPARPSNANFRLNGARRLVADLERKDLEYYDADGDTYLNIAVCRTDPYLITALLERLKRENLTSMINAQNNAGQTPLYLAVSTNDPGKVKVLLSEDADVTLYADYNGTKEKKAAIHCASSNGHTYLETLKALLTARGIQVDQLDSQGQTALHCAVLEHGKINSDNVKINSIPIIEALVNAGANPNLQVQNGRTALMFALETGCLDLFEKLFSLIDPVEREKCLRTQDFKGNSVFKIAERLKPTLEASDQQRLQSCLKRSSYQRNSGSGS